MTDPGTDAARTVGGLRTRYFPKSRIGHGLVTVAPWINVVLLLILFAIMDSRLVLRPGVTVRLPEGEFTDGARPVLVAVALSVGEGGRRKDIVFFDDDRYIAGQDGQMGGLEQSLAAHAARHPDAELVIQADRDVPHGTVVRLMNMAREVGIHRVSLALRERE